MNKIVNVLFVIGFCFVIFLVDIYNLREKSPFKINSSKIQSNKQNKFHYMTNFIDTFRTIALKHSADKVITHHYEYVYGQLLGPFRLENLNFLKIGLGCGMRYGPGKSIAVWKEFMPNAKISILEFDEKCARSFENEVDHLFIGDQSDLSLIKQIGEMGGKFDVIVDDGGHTRKQQISSLIGLWPFVRNNGGIYIIENIFTSFIPFYNENRETAIDLIFELITIFNDPSQVSFSPPFINSDIKISDHSKRISKDLMSINCFERACALIKK